MRVRAILALSTLVIAVIFFKQTRFPITTETRVASELSQSSPRLGMLGSLPPTDKHALRLVIISDTHGHYSRPLPHGDVLIHCGDSELSPDQLSEWLSQYGHRNAIAISGNMDRLEDKHDKFSENVTYLQDGVIELNGLKFYGSPWTPVFVGAFQLYSENDARKVWNAVPQNVDVLITHGPPADILDKTSRGARVGDRILADVVTTIKPRVHCFGHVHESYGTHIEGGTLFCNAAVYNGHPPVVVDIPFDRSRPAEIVKDLR